MKLASPDHAPAQQRTPPPGRDPGRPLAALRWTEALEAQRRLDGLADGILSLRPGPLRQGTVRDAAAGTWLGHALHPVLSDLPMGLWIGALTLDVLGGASRWRGAATTLTTAGVLAAVPVAATGLVEMADAPTRQRRVASVHAVCNAAAMGCFALSSIARLRGRHRTGAAVGLAGGAAAMAGGYLGGHLSFARGVGVDRSAEVHADHGPVELTEDGDGAGPLVGGARRYLRLRDVSAVVVDRCTRCGGSLEVVGDVLRCGRDGSRFDRGQGALLAGPATTPLQPLPLYDDGQPPHAGSPDR